MIFILFSLLISSMSLAEELTPLKVLSIYKDKKQFTFERREGDLPHYGIVITDVKKKKIFDVQVLKCGPKTCLGKITARHTGENISPRKNYLHSYKRAKADPEAAPEEAPYVSEHASPPSGEVYSAYLGYGSPIGSGVRAGFFRLITNKTMLGPNLTMVSQETNMVSLKATVFSFMVARRVIKLSENMDLNLLGEFGMAKGELDFSAVNSQGPKEEETTYLLGFGGELKYHIAPVALAVRGGLSKTGLKPEYENGNNKYDNPYGKLLSYVEFGIYYTF